MGLHEPREDLFKAVVVANARQMARVANADGGDGRPVIAELARELFGEVHRIAHATAVAATDQLAPAFNAIGHHQVASALNSFDV
jgi:hypothetical protein